MESEHSVLVDPQRPAGVAGVVLVALAGEKLCVAERADNGADDVGGEFKALQVFDTGLEEHGLGFEVGGF